MNIAKIAQQINDTRLPTEINGEWYLKTRKMIFVLRFDMDAETPIWVQCGATSDRDVKIPANAETEKITAYTMLGFVVLEEAKRCINWHRGGMRVAQTPRMPLSLAKRIVCDAVSYGIEQP